MNNRFSIEYSPYFCDELIKLGKEGKSETQMAAALGINIKRFRSWMKDPSIPEFREAALLAMTHSLAYHEDVLSKVAKGILRGNATSQNFLMKNRFPELYKESSESKIDLSNSSKNMTDKELDEMIAALIARKVVNNNSSGSSAQCS